MRRLLIGVLVGLAAAGALAPSASAEQAKAGPFVQEGIDGMTAIVLALPPDGDAKGSIHTCDVRRTRAICRLKITVSGYRPCAVTMVLTRGFFRFPAKNWRCPSDWRPQPTAKLSMNELSLKKALKRD